MDKITQRFEYPNGTLKNKLHEFNQNLLNQIEYERVAYIGVKILNNVSVKTESFIDLQKIHYLMFSWLYEWAGEIRDYNLSKGKTDFLPVNFLQRGIDEANKQIELINHKKLPTSRNYAILLDRLNFLHPFREGNGRATKIFISKLALNHHQSIDYQRNNDNIIKALIDADVEMLSGQIIKKNEH